MEKRARSKRNKQKNTHSLQLLCKIMTQKQRIFVPSIKKIRKKRVIGSHALHQFLNHIKIYVAGLLKMNPACAATSVGK